MLGDLRQMSKQFIHLSLSLSLSHICLCVNCIMMYILTNISHPDPVASLCGQCARLPHLPLVFGSGGMCVHTCTCIYLMSSSVFKGTVKYIYKITLHCGVKADRDTHLRLCRQHA